MGTFFTVATRTYFVGLTVFMIAAKTIEFVEECKKDEEVMKLWDKLKKNISTIGFEKREAKNV